MGDFSPEQTLGLLAVAAIALALLAIVIRSLRGARESAEPGEMTAPAPPPNTAQPAPSGPGRSYCAIAAEQSRYVPREPETPVTRIDYSSQAIPVPRDASYTAIAVAQALDRR